MDALSPVGGSAAAAGSAPPAPAAPSLLSLDSCEERILHLLQLASTVTASMSEVHPDALSEAQQAAKEFYHTLRLLHGSLLTHIRAHATELQHISGSMPAAPVQPTGAPSSAAAAAAAAAIAASAHEYRRNVYLDAQSMALAMENLDIYKERIQAAQRQSEGGAETGAVKQERR